MAHLNRCALLQNSTNYLLFIRFYSQTTSKLKCVGSPCRIIYTVCRKPPVSLLKLFDYIFAKTSFSVLLRLELYPYLSVLKVALQHFKFSACLNQIHIKPATQSVAYANLLGVA